MSENEIAALRALLASRPPRPTSVEGRRERMDALGNAYRIAEDIRLEPVSADGVPAEWSVAPGAEGPRVLLYLHGGGHMFGSIKSHRSFVSRRSAGSALRSRQAAAFWMAVGLCAGAANPPVLEKVSLVGFELGMEGHTHQSPIRPVLHLTGKIKIQVALHSAWRRLQPPHLCFLVLQND
jgi:hypothetical protein